MQNSGRVLPGIHDFVRRHRWWLVAWAAVALAFRAWFLIGFRLLTDDSYIYGEIAKNWLQTGVYGLTTTTGVDPTCIRMPGYPAFLAAIWAVSGTEHYTSVLVAQLIVDVAACFVVADLARRTVSEPAARVAFAIAALCPFFANYGAIALTETLAIFFAALALDWTAWAMEGDSPGQKRRWAAAGAAVAAGILLRPDGGLLLIAIGTYVLAQMFRRDTYRKPLVAGAFILAIVALAPLLPWTVRNWITLGEFQPLTPLYANSPGEFVPHGFHRWVRTWMVDYVSVEEIWFHVEGEAIDPGDLPSRALDSAEQRTQTGDLIAEYNRGLTITPALDAAFGRVAADRVHKHPLRYYLWLPSLRIAGLWLRPRTEMLPLDPHWWRWSDDPHDAAWSMALGVLNLLYVAFAIAAWRTRIRYVGLLLTLMAVRSVFLSWMPNPEPRYLLECYPALIVLTAAGMLRAFHRTAAGPSVATEPRDAAPSLH